MITFKQDYRIKLNKYSEKICSDEFVFKSGLSYDCERVDLGGCWHLKVYSIDKEVWILMNNWDGIRYLEGFDEKN